MRASTLVSVILALVLAGLAVFGVQTYLAAQRAAIAEETQALASV